MVDELLTALAHPPIGASSHRWTRRPAARKPLSQVHDPVGAKEEPGRAWQCGPGPGQARGGGRPGGPEQYV